VLHVAVATVVAAFKAKILASSWRRQLQLQCEDVALRRGDDSSGARLRGGISLLQVLADPSLISVKARFSVLADQVGSHPNKRELGASDRAAKDRLAYQRGPAGAHTTTSFG
jgi:hypothetical protein